MKSIRYLVYVPVLFWTLLPPSGCPCTFLDLFNMPSPCALAREADHSEHGSDDCPESKDQAIQLALSVAESITQFIADVLPPSPANCTACTVSMLQPVETRPPISAETPLYLLLRAWRN